MRTLGASVFCALLAGLVVQAGDNAEQKKDLANLTGNWKITKFNGEQSDKLVGGVIEFETDGKSVTFTVGCQVKKAKFSINSAGKPKEIDLTPDEAGAKKMVGVFKLEKTTLTICIGPDDPATGRPNEFKHDVEKKWVLVTLEKSK